MVYGIFCTLQQPVYKTNLLEWLLQKGKDVSNLKQKEANKYYKWDTNSNYKLVATPIVGHQMVPTNTYYNNIETSTPTFDKIFYPLPIEDSNYSIITK